MKTSFRIGIAWLLSIVLVFGSVMPAAAEEQTQTTQEATECADLYEAAAVLRENMVKRQATISVTFLSESDDSQVMRDLLNEALVHTGVPTQGDYLYWSIQKCSVKLETQEQDGQYRLTLTYTVAYYTTAEQEAQLDTAVKELLEQLNVYDADDFEKVSAIYDYICENVKYDSWGVMTGDKLIYSAYAALVQNRAVCQGYATLFYRLALELGLDARVIAGTSKGQSHGWNIVRLGGNFYNLDATWDAELAQKDKPYEYFLRCDSGFEKHTRKEAYTTEEFQYVYLMAQEDYSHPPTVRTGDLTGDGQVGEDDAIYLLQHVLLPGSFPVDQAVDYTTDSAVDEDDAIYLLQYVLMPEMFPL